MFIDHILFYGIGIVLLDIGYLIHPIFYIFFFIYFLFLLKRIGFISTIPLIILSIILLRPQSTQDIPSKLSGYVIDIRDNYIILRTKYGKIKAYTNEELLYHDEIDINTSKLTIHHASNDHGFSEYYYLKANHIVSKVSITQIHSIKHHFSITNIINTYLSSNTKRKSYQKLFLLGIKDDDISNEYSQMTDLSIVHIFALSGMHMTILYSLLLKILNLFMSKEHSPIIVKILLGLYVFSIPPNISMQRAYYMLVGEKYCKEKSSLNLLFLLVLIHILINPYIIYSQSFVFSYFLYMIVIYTRGHKYSSLLIYLSSIPLIIHTQYQINLISFLLLSIISPFIEYFYQITILSFIFPILLPLLTLCIYIFEHILAFTSDISQYWTFSYPPISFIVLYYGCFFSMLYHLEMKQHIHKHICFLLSLLISFHIYSTYHISCEIGMINVGQGDCTYIQLPFNQGNILIDTGGNRDYDLATNTLIPFLKSKGIHELDYVYISHYDYDHYGALDSLQKHFNVKEVIDKEDNQDIGDLHIRTLHNSKYYSDINDMSQVLYITYKDTHYLFTGDISILREHDIYETYKQLDVDILKVAHHGSKSSSSVEFFEMVHPSIAFIGVGENNHYGHPTQIVLDRLKQRHIKILRTDQDGNFCIKYYGKDYYVYR